MKKLSTLSVVMAGLFCASSFANLSKQSTTIAEYAVQQYQSTQIHTLANLVSFPTVNKEGIDTTQNPDFIGFKSLVKLKAAELGFHYEDHGHVLLISYGNQADKVTVVTHGDVQPADASKWKKSPFYLDATSEPGKLIARGSEDDKGAIATALYAMKAIKDKGLVLNNKLELMIYLAEESDWDPIKAFLKSYDQPKYAVTIDASYPVVVAEKGWSLIEPTFTGEKQTNGVFVSQLKGGSFKSQIPEDASVILHNADADLLQQLEQKANQFSKVQIQFKPVDSGTLISVKGVSAHSSEPENGVNAIAHLGALFHGVDLGLNSEGQALKFIADLLGTDIHGEQFGNIAYSHDFMGPMTVAPTLLAAKDNSITLSINLRRPAGKTAERLDTEIHTAIDAWQNHYQVALAHLEVELGDPMLLDGAPHAEKLLDIFKHYTNDQSAGFISIGGGTNAKLFDNAVSFGPSMPNAKYTGHSEHEFITVKQLELNLRMYTAMMIELGNM